jgi:hypothetical protein
LPGPLTDFVKHVGLATWHVLERRDGGHESATVNDSNQISFRPPLA